MMALNGTLRGAGGMALLWLAAGLAPAHAQPLGYPASAHPVFCSAHAGEMVHHAAHHGGHDPWATGGELTVPPPDPYGALVERFNELVFAYERLAEQNRRLTGDYDQLLRKYNDAMARNDAVEVCLCSATSLQEAQACPYR